MASYLSKSMPLVERVLAGPKTYAEICVICKQCARMSTMSIFSIFFSTNKRCRCFSVYHVTKRTFFHLFLRVGLLSLVAEAQGPESLSVCQLNCQVKTHQGFWILENLQPTQSYCKTSRQTVPIATSALHLKNSASMAVRVAASSELQERETATDKVGQK